MHWSALTLWSFLLLLLLVLGFFMPLQTDEIAWSYANQRGIIDHFSVITLLPQCQAADSFAKPLPLSWYPYAFLNHLVFMQVDSLIWIRLVGMARFVLFLTASWFVVKPLAFSVNISPHILFFLLLSLLGLSSLPLAMQVTRPEQTLFLSAAIYLTLGLNAPVIARHTFSKYAATAIFFITVLLSFPSHAKAIATLPLALACAYVFFRASFKSRWVYVLSMLAVIGFSSQSAFFWLQRYVCPDSVASQQMIAYHSLPWGLLWQNPIDFITVALHVFLQGIATDFNPYNDDGNWLPFSLVDLPGWAKALYILCRNTGYVINIGLFCFCILFFLLTLISFIRSIVAKTYAHQQKDFSSYAILACSFTFSLVGIILITGRIRIWYLPTLELPLLYWASLLSVAATYKNLSSRRIQHYVWIVIAFAAGNILLLGYRYYPYITDASTRERIMKFGTEMPVSEPVLHSPWNYEAQTKNIEEAYKACGLPSDITTAQHLILDDYTYPALKHSYQPFDFIFSTDIVNSPFNVKALFQEMKKYDSQGIMLNCKFVPAGLVPFLEEHNGYCCMSGKIIP